MRGLLFLGELLLPDVRTPQLDVEHALHRAEHLLVGRGGAALKVLDHRHGRVALGRQLLLRHLVPFLVAAAPDRLRDLHAYRLGLHDVVASVDFGQVLAFDGGGAASLVSQVRQLVLDNGKVKWYFFLLTALPVENFFSVATIRPDRWAAFRALRPLTTVSRCTPPPRCLLPMRVTESQSLDILM